MKVIPSIFTYSDLKDIYPNVGSFYAFVNRWNKKGKIKQIKKGVYALIDLSTGNLYCSKFQIACSLFKDAYFSYHEALEYYGLANQCFVSSFVYLTHFYARTISFEENDYISKKSNTDQFIINRMNEEGIRVVSKERCIIDCIDNMYLGGGLEEIENALENVKTLNEQNLTTILDFYNKNFLFQKAGYLLKKHLGDALSNSFYEYCKSKIGNKINYLEKKEKGCSLNSEWKLMIHKEKEFPNELF